MHKRGQVTLFIIIGIVLILVIGLLFLFRGFFIEQYQSATNVEKYLGSQMKAIDKEIGECLYEETSKALVLFGKQGGYFKPSASVRYYGENVAVLCQNIPGEDYCLSSGFVEMDVEDRLEDYVMHKFNSCVSLESYKDKDYSFVTSSKQLFVNVNEDNVLMELNYPITLTKGAVSVERENFARVINVPLGRVVKVVSDILEDEATVGSFDPVTYGVDSYGKHLVVVRKPYPDKVYDVNIEGSDYHFKFAVTGEGRYA